VRRREFIALLGAVAAWPPSGRAEQPDRIRKIGILFGGFSSTDPESQARVKAFTRQLGDLGWIEGQNVKFDVRFGGGDENQRQAYAKELVDMAPDVLVANSSPAVLALAHQTKTIPTVFANVFDPVGDGVVASLARPGGNVTGFSNFEPTMTGKWLELLTEIAPNVTRVAAMFDSDNPASIEFDQTVGKMAPSFHLQYLAAPVSNAAEIQEVVDAIGREANGGLIVMGGTVTSAYRDAIVQVSARRRVPAVYAFRYYVTSGGLLSYGVDGIDIFRRCAAYVDFILKGAKPADLPVQTPTKFEFIINLKTAKALGLRVPTKLLEFADEVIE
jgi:putative tryptophan/tyrosine transport system substrate-binding protein